MTDTSTTSTSSELSFADVTIAVASLRGRQARVTIMTATDPPAPVCTMDGTVVGQQQDEDHRAVTYFSLRPGGTFALDSDRFIAAQRHQVMGMGKVLMVRQGELMIAIEAD